MPSLRLALVSIGEVAGAATLVNQGCGVGAWGPGSFENDGAVNWLNRLCTSGNVSDVVGELEIGVQLPMADLSSESERVRAAAEVVLASFNGGPTESDPDFADCFARFHGAFSSDDVMVAERAVQRVAELYETRYVDESTAGFREEFDLWRRFTLDIVERGGSAAPANEARREAWLRDTWAQFVTASREAYASICDLRQRLCLLRAELHK